MVLLAMSGCLGWQAAAATYTLVTEPDQGLTPIYELISSARNTLDMTMYELTDPAAEQLLAQAAASGVAVRVTLDQNLEKKSNTAAYNYLIAHGVAVHWANPKYAATHQKTITVDGATSAIMTLNLTSQFYATDRDFAVIDNDPADVAAIEATFDADLANTAVTPPDGDDLVWSPTNAQSAILDAINAAQNSLLIENEEMSDTNVINALRSAAARGVTVQVVMTNSSDAYASEFKQLVEAGAEVSTYTASAPLYIHAKVILADSGRPGARVLIGSANFSSASLTRNRELGLVLSDPAIAHAIEMTLSSDFNGGTPWPGSGQARVVNTASSQAGLASGAWFTIFGTNLSPVTDDWTNSIVNGTLPTSLDGVTVTVGGQPAYPAYISPVQINAVAPDIPAGTVLVTVSDPNGAPTLATAVAHSVQPAFFQWGAYVVATHEDYSDAVKNGTLSHTTAPAAPGEIIILWGTGFGPTRPVAPAGRETLGGTVYYLADAVTVALGNTPAPVVSTSLAPGFAGLYQVAIRIPDSLADGDYPVVATVSGAQSPPNILLTVVK